MVLQLMVRETYIQTNCQAVLCVQCPSRGQYNTFNTYSLPVCVMNLHRLRVTTHQRASAHALAAARLQLDGGVGWPLVSDPSPCTFSIVPATYFHRNTRIFTLRTCIGGEKKWENRDHSLLQKSESHNSTRCPHLRLFAQYVSYALDSSLRFVYEIYPYAQRARYIIHLSLPFFPHVLFLYPTLWVITDPIATFASSHLMQ